MKNRFQFCGVDPGGKQYLRRGRNDRERHYHGGDKRKGFGESQGCEEFAFGPGHGENRQEADDGGCNRCQHRTGDLAGCPKHNFQRRFTVLCIIHVPENVLADDHAHIDHGADGDGDTGQRNDVCRNPELLHRDEGHENGNRQ